MLGFREFEVVKVFQPWRFYSTIIFHGMALSTWNSLPPDVQKTIDEISKEYAVIEAIAWDQADIMGYDYAQERGVAMNPWKRTELKRARAITDGVLKEYVTTTKAKGLPAQEFLGELQRLTIKYSPYEFPF